MQTKTQRHWEALQTWQPALHCLRRQQSQLLAVKEVWCVQQRFASLLLCVAFLSTFR